MILSPTQAAKVWYNKAFQLKRTSGFYDRGVYQRRGTELSWHKGNFQPSGQRDIERLPEGSRADGSVVLFTCVSMRTAEAGQGVADRVLFKGTEYEVSTVEAWPSHYRYVLTKVGQ